MVWETQVGATTKLGTRKARKVTNRFKVRPPKYQSARRFTDYYIKSIQYREMIVTGRDRNGQPFCPPWPAIGRRIAGLSNLSKPKGNATGGVFRLEALQHWHQSIGLPVGSTGRREIVFLRSGSWFACPALAAPMAIARRELPPQTADSLVT